MPATTRPWKPPGVSAIRDWREQSFSIKAVLANDRQQYDRAVDLYKQALKLFQDANDDASIMRTCNLLGSVEAACGSSVRSQGVV